MYKDDVWALTNIVITKLIKISRADSTCGGETSYMTQAKERHIGSTDEIHFSSW